MRRFALAGVMTLAAGTIAVGGTAAYAGSTPSTTTPTTQPEASPATSEPPVPAPDAVSTVTLNLVGSPLVAAVTTDAGGGLVDVTLTPATGYDPTNVRPNKVAFVNEDGGVTVKVSAKRGGERVEARAGELADISGPGGWSGDVFDSGDTTTVAFTVGAAADGVPDITGITVTSPLDHEIGEVRRETGDDDDGDDDGESEQSASVRITFERAGQTRTLSIKAEVESEDGETQSKLRISLSRIKGSLLADGPAVGPHSWSGQLCDGSAASFTYNVSDSGEITDIVATRDADIDIDGNEATVRFGDDERVSIEVRGDGDEMTVSTRERFRCDRVDPTVNGSTVPTTVEDEDDDDDHSEDDDRHGDGRDDDDEDDRDGSEPDNTINDDDAGDDDAGDDDGGDDHDSDDHGSDDHGSDDHGGGHGDDDGD